ncbi:MAG: N-acetylmuramic acid 6-phosphate etherase [Pirellulaceae bacterium]|nr:N-acetylmuramic acid 6-phosphate etherase [Pirellulaceae bacterium]
MDLAQLTTEARNPASEQIDRLSALEIVQLMNAEDCRVPLAVGQVAAAVAAAVEGIAERMRRGGRLIYLGAGTSGRLGVLDASECPPTFNSRPWQVVGLIAGGPTALTRAVEGAEDRPETAIEDLQRVNLSGDDAVVGIATSGRTPYVVGGLRYAGQIGALTVGLTCNADSELTAVARQMIVPVVGPEVISGSTRLKAGTATKLVLNMLTTGVMVKLGKTYGNLMVDLQTTNQKLTHRSRRIVGQLTGVSDDQASALLQRCGGDTKTAIVAQLRGVSPQEAQRLLAAAGGQLRGALEAGKASPAHDPTGGLRQGLSSVPSANLVLGVDGGGTKTVAWLASTDGDELRIVGCGEAGSSNPQAAGWATALDNVQCAIDRALLAADAGRTRVRNACLALAGAGRDSDRQRVEDWARRSGFAEQVQVTHDALPVLAAGTPNGVGVALISGTGSLAFGRNAAGQTARAGGWGYLIGDEGSGYAVARQTLQAAARAWDGRGPQTALGERLLAELGLTQPSELVHAVYGRQQDRHWLAGLARVAIEAADAGDPIACRIIDEAAADLAAMCAAVAKQLGFSSGPTPLYLALAGGLLVNAAAARDRLMQKIRERDFQRIEIQLVPEPVAGAVRLARDFHFGVR